ncbi:helix-turn-helix transcriptional regulator [Rhodococcus sp. UNC363MFTsu5.1]|uniref:helix-turn-helix transcriptional regulator n=1 Tax=Rhodococcus sp. UNC363MFTsu5.1 TaxID=1449069 RepID=UPI0004811D64|nr:transcriptional regulator [Rhodococcus sp. UNC363MFTsu5.1]
MPERFLSITEVAERLGIDRSAASHYKLPEPDAWIGKTRGWRASTIDEWNAKRPGRGARTDLRES